MARFARLYLLILAGCSDGWIARGRASTITTCHAVPQITAEYPISCSTMRTNLNLARAILERRHLVPDDQFPTLRAPIHVRRADSWSDGMVGSYAIFSGIDVAHDGRALVHELLHEWQVT